MTSNTFPPLKRMSCRWQTARGSRHRHCPAQPPEGPPQEQTSHTPLRLHPAYDSRWTSALSSGAFRCVPLPLVCGNMPDHWEDAGWHSQGLQTIGQLRRHRSYHPRAFKTRDWLSPYIWSRGVNWLRCCYSCNWHIKIVRSTDRLYSASGGWRGVFGTYTHAELLCVCSTGFHAERCGGGIPTAWKDNAMIKQTTRKDYPFQIVSA